MRNGYQKALEYLEGKRGQQGKPAGAREGRKEDGRGNLLEQGKEGGQQGKPAGAREGERTAGRLGFHDLWLRRRWSRSEILK